MIEDWDGQCIHYCLEVYQSAPDATMACERKLSTWRNPKLPKKHKYAHLPQPACDVGYSFSAEEVDCPKCRVWIEANCPSCRTCGVRCTYGTCHACVVKEIEAAGGKQAWLSKLFDD
jgi:hypothetical protein